MTQFMDDLQLDELRHLWHSLLGHWRCAKSDTEFGSLHELPPSDTGAIDLVAENPDIIMREIGEALHLPKSTLTSLIDRLEKQGFLRRIVSSRDRRSYGIELTPLGMQAYTEHVQLEALMWQQIMEILGSEGDGELFLVMLRKIVTGLSSPNEKQG